MEDAIKEIEEEKIQASNKAKEDVKSKIIKEKNDTKKFDKERILKKQSRLIKIKKQSNLMILIFKMSFRIQLRKLLRLTLTISKRRQRCFQIH